MAGPFDFLHIKGRTAGTSNELSFDVLDAARHDLDERRRANRASRPSTAPRASQGSYAGVAGTSTLSAVPEVERRKRARRARAIRLRVLAVVVIVALMAAGGYAGYRFYSDTLDYTGRFGTLIDRLVEVDRSLVEVDSLMSDPLNTVEREKRDAALAGFDDLEGRLDAIVNEARQMGREAANGDDASALGQVEDAARARSQMLSAASAAFKLSEIANRQIEEAVEAWNLVLAGDAVAREATAMANAAATEDATTQARGKTEEAIDLMTTGRAQLGVIQQGIAGLDFSSEIAYIDKRIESLERAVETADALVAGDRAAAIAANDAYNVADRAATELATTLPASVSDQVKAQYADEVAVKKGAYSTARSTASTVDSALRSYYRGAAS